MKQERQAKNIRTVGYNAKLMKEARAIPSSRQLRRELERVEKKNNFNLHTKTI